MGVCRILWVQGEGVWQGVLEMCRAVEVKGGS